MDGGLDLTHTLIQIPIDGLHVNWKTIDIIDDQLKTEDSNSLNLTDIGSYGLHVMYSTYRSTQKATEWPLD